MKRIAPPVLAAAIVTLTQAAAARPTPRKPTTTTKTASYVEERIEGDQVVIFTGDELPVDGRGAYGDTIRRPPGILRQLLIRPRLNFVPELRKTVENL
jgi:hypothetical protein